MERLKRRLPALTGLFLAAAMLLLVFVPPARSVFSDEKHYHCVWEDGTTEESFASASFFLDGIAEDGRLRLVDGDRTGYVSVSPSFGHAYAILCHGDLFELLTSDMGGLDPLERTALYARFSETVFYSSGAFSFDGAAVHPSDPVFAREVVLLDGPLPSGYLKEMGAVSLRIASEAEISPYDLAGSKVIELSAESPYRTENGALYRDTPGGVRFVCSLPDCADLTVSDCDFADMGSLFPSQNLVSVRLPFVGSAKNAQGSDFQGRFAYLWSKNGEIFVPETLKRAEVTGGVLVAYAFYGAPALEEVTACGIPAHDVSRQAFSGVPSLRLIHSPRDDLELDGTFEREPLPCGCTLYRRTGGIQ